METAQLVKCLDAHFARIIDIQPLTVGSWNSVITASIDRTVKVWNINYIFEQVHHIGGFHLHFFIFLLSTNCLMINSKLSDIDISYISWSVMILRLMLLPNTTVNSKLK